MEGTPSPDHFAILHFGGPLAAAGLAAVLPPLWPPASAAPRELPELPCGGKGFIECTGLLGGKEAGLGGQAAQGWKWGARGSPTFQLEVPVQAVFAWNDLHGELPEGSGSWSRGVESSSPSAATARGRDFATGGQRL